MPPSPLSRRPSLLAVAVVVLALVAAGVVLAARGRASVDASGPPRPDDPEPGPTPSVTDPPALASGTPRAVRRPNILLLLTDDMRADDLRWMPHVRELIGARGLDFHNSFSPNPLCAPARASLLSGQDSHNHHVFSHQDPYGFAAFDDRRTVATSLHAAGYRTFLVGKYLNGYGEQPVRTTGASSLTYVPPGWDQWHAALTPPSWSGYRGGTYDYFDTLFDVDGQVDTSHDGEYQSDVIGDTTSGLIRDAHRSRRPFFGYVAPVAPHFGTPQERDDPMDVPAPRTGARERIKTPARPKWVRGRFDREIRRASGLPLDGGPSERDVRDKPRPIRDAPELSGVERAAVRSSTRQRAEALYVFDRQVQRIVATLRRTHELADTVLMFTSDNGYFLGEHRVRQGKIKPHEPSLRTPFLVAGPGVPHGDRYDPVTTAGIAATILALAHARPPHEQDGASVLGSFRHDWGWSAPVVTEGLEGARVFRDASLHPAPGFDDARTTIGIRTSRWSYVRYDDGDGELYDLDRDPNQLRSRFGDRRYAGVSAALEHTWAAYKDCRGVSCTRPMAESLRRTAEEERADLLVQSAGVERRVGYRR